MKSDDPEEEMTMPQTLEAVRDEDSQPWSRSPRLAQGQAAPGKETGDAQRCCPDTSRPSASGQMSCSSHAVQDAVNVSRPSKRFSHCDTEVSSHFTKLNLRFAQMNMLCRSLFSMSPTKSHDSRFRWIERGCPVLSSQAIESIKPGQLCQTSKGDCTCPKRPPL